VGASLADQLPRAARGLQLQLTSETAAVAAVAVTMSNMTLYYRHFIKGAITSKIKHAIKHKTSPARLAQLLKPSLAFCFSLHPMTAYTVQDWTVHCHWLQAKTKC